MYMEMSLEQGSGPVITHEHPLPCKRSPLELLDILIVVAEHMDQQTLYRSIQVSHLWNSAFLPSLWSTIKIHHLSRHSFELVAAHAKYIRELALMDDVDLRYGTDFFCPNLTRLTIKCFLHLDCYYRPPAYAFSDLIRRHRYTLESVRFCSPTDKSLWVALEGCTQLKNLFIKRLAFTEPEEWLSLYDRIWSRLTVLELAGYWGLAEIPKALLLHPSENFRPPAKIQDLILSQENFALDEGQRRAQIQVQGWIVQQCRSLVHCDWVTPNIDEELGPVQQLADILLSSDQEVWPQLESLRLLQDFRVDDFTIVVDRLTRLTELQMCKTNFDEICWDALRRNDRHLASLRTMIFSDCPFVSGRIIQAMMALLPNLEQLEAGNLSVQDILDDGRPWICLRLKELRVSIALDSLESQPMILERVSRLVKLEECRLHDTESQEPFLQLTLESGLDQLRTLKQMQYFQVGPPDRSNIKWSKEEVQWTRDHWPRLKDLFEVELPLEDIDHSPV